MPINSFYRKINPNFNTAGGGSPLAPAAGWTSWLTQPSQAVSRAEQEGHREPEWAQQREPVSAWCCWLPARNPSSRALCEWMGSKHTQSGFWNLNKCSAIIYKIVVCGVEIMKGSSFSLCFIGKHLYRETDSSVINHHGTQLFWNMVSVFDCRVCRLQTVGMQCLSFFTYCLLVHKYRIWQFSLKP